MEPTKKHYLYLLAASYIAVAIVLTIKGEVPTSPTALGGFIGGGLGVAVLPLVAMRFLGNTAGWIVFAIFLLGYSQSQLNWLGTPAAATPSASALGSRDIVANA